MPNADTRSLAGTITDLQRRLAALERSPQLGNSSVVLDGSSVKVTSALKTGIAASANATVALQAANGKNSVTYSLYSPSEAGTASGDVWFQLNDDDVVTNQYQWDGHEWVSVKLGDETIASITAGKITTGSLQAGTRIIAGDENRTHAELTDTGLRIFSEDLSDGVPNEAIRLGTVDNDFFAITDADGNHKATIDQNGQGNFTSLNVAGDAIFGGIPLSTQLATTAPYRGGFSATLGSNLGPIQGQYGLIEASAPLVAGRAYELVWTCTWYADDAPTEARFYLKSTHAASGTTSAAPTPTINSATTENIWYQAASPTAGNYVTSSGTTLIFPSASAQHRFLLVAEHGVGPGHVFIVGSAQIELTIRDMGPVANTGTGSLNNGGGSLWNQAPPPPPVVVQNYFLDVQPAWSQTYRQNGSLRTDTSDVIQGLVPGDPGGNGIGYGLFGWPDLMGQIGGSTIDRMDVYFYTNNWYYNDGGKLVLNLHGNTYPGAPYRVGNKLDWVPDVMWPKSGGLWVSMPSDWYGLFANGTARGITIGPANGDPIFYGRVNGANTGIGFEPGLKIWYRK